MPSGRGIVFTFAYDRQELLEALLECYEEGFEVKTVVNLSWRSRLENAPEGVKVKHISEYAVEAREKAYRWVLSLGQEKLSRGSLINAITYRGIPVWWFVEISLQEKAFLAVRLVESVLKALEVEGAEGFAVVGSDKEHPWIREIVKRTCKVKGLREVVTLDVESGPHIWELEAPKAEVRVVKKVASRVDRTIWRIIYTLTALSFPVIMFMAAIFRVAISVVVKPVLAVWKGMIRIAKAELGLTLKSAVLSGIEEAVRVLRIPTMPDIRRFLGLFRRAPTLEVVKPWRSVLLMAEAAGVKERRDFNPNKRSFYINYIEGVPESLDKACEAAGLKVITVYYGGSAPPLTGGGSIRLSDFLDFRVLEEARRDIALAWEEVEDVVKDVVKYREVNLWPVFKDLGYFFLENGSDAALYVKVCRKILDEVKPACVVLYNYEGVFRKIVAAALLEKVPCLGVQQALGPYGHALDKRGFGYRLAGLQMGGEGFPAPTKICVWSTLHKEVFASYGYPSENLEVTGYTRLDIYLRDRKKLDRRFVRKLLGIEENAKVVMFTGVLRAAGSPIVLEDNYVETLRALRELSEEFEKLYVVVKPWPGDLLDVILRMCRIYGNEKFIFISPNTNLHNSYLLFASDFVIGSFSSLFSEAIVMGNICILLDYPESIYYFEPSHLKLYEHLALRVKRPEEVKPTIKKLLEADEEELKKIRERTLEEVERVFGPLDGKTSERIARTALKLAELRVGMNTKLAEKKGRSEMS